MQTLNIIALDVKGNKLKITNTVTITAGSENVDVCLFTFDNEWQDYTKIAVFSTADGDEYTELIVNNRCTVPVNCLKKNGLLRIGAIGKNNGAKIMSTNFVSHRIISGANENGAARYSEEYFSEAGSNTEYNSSDEEISLDVESVDIDLEQTGFSLDELCALYPEYAQKNTAQNDFEYFGFSCSDYKKTVVIKYDSEFAANAIADFIYALCSASGENSVLNIIFTTVRFIVFSSENYADFFDENEFENLIFAVDFSLNDTGPLSKIIIFSKNGGEKYLMKTVEKFDRNYSENGTTVFVKSENGFAGFASETLHADSCGIEWNENDSDSEKFIDFLKRIVVSGIIHNDSCGAEPSKSFTKHIMWRSSAPDDVFALDSDIRTLWISLYKTKLDGFYDVALSGYALIKSQNGGRIVLRPVLYQENVDKMTRFADPAFDTECTVNPGISSVPMNSVIYGNYSNEDALSQLYPSKLGAVLRSKAVQGDAEIIGFSYTLSAVESNGSNTEILVPQGLAADYESEENPPVFMVKSFETDGEENE